MKQIVVKQWDKENQSFDDFMEEIKKDNAECGNTVNAENFNETMKGYTAYAIKDAKENLKEKGYSEEQINEITQSFRRSVNWGIDMMTMEEARKYNEKY